MWRDSSEHIWYPRWKEFIAKVCDNVLSVEDLQTRLEQIGKIPANETTAEQRIDYVALQEALKTLGKV